MFGHQPQQLREPFYILLGREKYSNSDSLYSSSLQNRGRRVKGASRGPLVELRNYRCTDIRTHAGEEYFILLAALPPGLQDGVAEGSAVQCPNQTSGNRLLAVVALRHARRGRRAIRAVLETLVFWFL